jgi:hypothetical protein
MAAKSSGYGPARPHVAPSDVHLVGARTHQFYDDTYRETMGPERHPSALGAPGRECWYEIWDIIGPQIEYVLAGKGATWHEDQLVPVTRHGRPRECLVDVQLWPD